MGTSRQRAYYHRKKKAHECKKILLHSDTLNFHNLYIEAAYEYAVALQAICNLRRLAQESGWKGSRSDHYLKSLWAAADDARPDSLYHKRLNNGMWTVSPLNDILGKYPQE
jgi:hypothetical protein